MRVHKHGRAHSQSSHRTTLPHYMQCMVPLKWQCIFFAFLLIYFTVFYIILVSHFKSSKIEWGFK